MTRATSPTPPGNTPEGYGVVRVEPGPTPGAPHLPEARMSSTTTYTVTGMSCGHCEKAISEELSALTGVTEVAADSKAGTVTVSSLAPLDDEQVRSAVDEAGYELVGRSA
ncbi:heavy-metal-associated domain-containing protein [Kitasatospora sp. NPDC127121]|uniref:heavy-metal-associated domain-containing protein n=2 Tax=Kitasatospora TaxID=2063 RepID=UPI00362A372F